MGEKERHRTMRSAKRTQSALNVSHPIAHCGNRLNRGGMDMAALIA